MTYHSSIYNQESKTYTIEEVGRERLREIIDKKIKENKANTTYNEDQLLVANIFDFETTGIEDDDEATELSVFQVQFCPQSKKILGLLDSYTSFNEPEHKEISEEITKITNIDAETVRGHKIDWEIVRDFFKKGVINVAHNAGFDMFFIEKYLGEKFFYGCSLKGVDWSDFRHSKQEDLCEYHGMKYVGHRADIDVLALIALLLQEDYFQQVLEDSKIERSLIIPYGSSYHKRHYLKSCGHEWLAPQKLWVGKVPSENCEDYVQEVKEMAYDNPNSAKVVVKRISLKDNYKKIERLL